MFELDEEYAESDIPTVTLLYGLTYKRREIIQHLDQSLSKLLWYIDF